MALKDLDDSEKKVVRECLEAAVNGPFFPDWEFRTLFGIEREQVRVVLDAWPDVDDANENVMLSINNSMNNLLGYPHGCDQQWHSFVSVSPDEVERVFSKWRG
jgi:hypothetical protein